MILVHVPLKTGHFRPCDICRSPDRPRSNCGWRHWQLIWRMPMPEMGCVQGKSLDIFLVGVQVAMGNHLFEVDFPIKISVSSALLRLIPGGWRPRYRAYGCESTSHWLGLRLVWAMAIGPLRYDMNCEEWDWAQPYSGNQSGYSPHDQGLVSSENSYTFDHHAYFETNVTFEASHDMGMSENRVYPQL